ncbi:putative secreted [Diaporthe ampelina]|uniref:Putative secreted n=1 Tax=Diaporthe ampelina TaxID=1214573 RepID=A0A0G2IGQ2_9PEZI|nr:putative secreted [Diaporthe ampelina]
MVACFTALFGALVLLPPRRRLTTSDIPVTSVGYTRDPQRLIAYLIPLPPPSSKGQTLNVPQRYVIYTPPAPHLLKPSAAAAAAATGSAGTKEGKRHKAKRLVQQEVKKAKTYDGKTLSLRGLHYKAVRGCDRAVAAIKSSDITFLNRVPRKRVTELVLIHPASVLADHTPGEVHAEVGAQLARTQRRAARDSIISTLLFPPSLVIDTLAAVVWPFGGLAEIDGVWMYASISGYLTARNVTRRMEREPVVDGEAHGEPVQGGQSRAGRGLSPVSEEDIYSAGIEASRPDAGVPGRRDSRRDSRQVHFEEVLDEDEEEDDLKRAAGNDGTKDGKKKTLKVRMVPDDAMDTMASYFQEICHQRNPKAFGSSGIPPTKTEVLASIGWCPDKRGRAPGVEHPGDWDDENWQTRQVKEDMDKVLTKAAKSWDKWCKSYAKYPERAMKEKGHSRTSEVLRKLRVKEDSRGPRMVV